MTFWAAGTLVVGSVVGAKVQSDAAGRAANKQSAAADRATALEHEQYLQTREDNLPFMQTGYKANDQLTNMLDSGAYKSDPTFSKYTQDPSYQWQQSEARKALEGSASARGGLYSGATMRALQDRSQNIANADYGNWWNRQYQGLSNRTNMLNAIRSGGQASINNVNQAGQNYAQNAGNNAIGAANAQGAAGIASANSWSNALNSAAGMYFGGAYGKKP